MNHFPDNLQNIQLLEFIKRWCGESLDRKKVKLKHLLKEVQKIDS